MNYPAVVPRPGKLGPRQLVGFPGQEGTFNTRTYLQGISGVSETVNIPVYATVPPNVNTVSLQYYDPAAPANHAIATGDIALTRSDRFRSGRAPIRNALEFQDNMVPFINTLSRERSDVILIRHMVHICILSSVIRLKISRDLMTVRSPLVQSLQSIAPVITNFNNMDVEEGRDNPIDHINWLDNDE
jgi:hypothetical protein